MRACRSLAIELSGRKRQNAMYTPRAVVANGVFWFGLPTRAMFLDRLGCLASQNHEPHFFLQIVATVMTLWISAG